MEHLAALQATGQLPDDVMRAEEVDLTELASLQQIPDNFFKGMRNLKRADLGPLCNVRSIGAFFLSECASLKGLDLSCLPRLAAVGEGFLCGCSSLEMIVWSVDTRLMRVGPSFLSGCCSLRTIDLDPMSDLTVIPEYFLSACRALTCIDLAPLAKVTKIGWKCLSGCSGLRGIDLGPLIRVHAIANGFLDLCSGLAKVYLPKGSEVLTQALQRNEDIDPRIITTEKEADHTPPQPEAQKTWTDVRTEEAIVFAGNEITVEAIQSTIHKESLAKIDESFKQYAKQCPEKSRTELSMLAGALASTGVVMSLDKNAPSSNMTVLDGAPPPTPAITASLKIHEKDANLPPHGDPTLTAAVAHRIAKAMNVLPSEVHVLSVTRGSYDIKCWIPQALIDKMVQVLGPTVLSEQQRVLNSLQRAASYVKSCLEKNVRGLVHGTVSTFHSLICTKFNINPEDLDKRGDVDFDSPGGRKETRGGMPYYQPATGWRRIGLRVVGIYGDESWLAMDGNPGEWAVAFHGTSTDGDAAFSGIANSRTIAPGRKNVWGASKATNRPDPIPNPGIYFAQRIDQCYKMQSTLEGTTYEVAFQCRVDPAHVWETGNGQTWIVVDDPRSVRPYGICYRAVEART